MRQSRTGVPPAAPTKQRLPCTVHPLHTSMARRAAGTSATFTSKGMGANARPLSESRQLLHSGGGVRQGACSAGGCSLS